MKIIKAKYILLCNDKFDILENSAICFDEKIIDIGKIEELIQKYPNVEVIDYENSVLMPSLINPHVHLEYSTNRTLLNYGEFVPWLKSIIDKREEIVNSNLEEKMRQSIEEMTKSGVGVFGEISSYGLDLEVCVGAKQKVIFFHEILGSKPEMLDMLYGDFIDRLESSKQFKSSSFIPAISVHSPYTTHQVLAKKALEIAKKENLLVSTHFMESIAEREWLDSGEGEFKEFFTSFFPHAKPANRPLEYLELFRGVKTLFTHVVYTSPKEREKIKEIGYITHCPISNRLLGNKALDLRDYEEFTLGTDGYSSNYSLNIWNELRVALILHNYIDLNLLSKKLLQSVTKVPAKALNLNSGEIKVGNSADLAIFKLKDKIEDINRVATMLILYTNEVESLYIDGELI